MQNKRAIIIAGVVLGLIVGCIFATISALRSGAVGVDVVALRDPGQPVVEEYTLPDERLVLMPKQGLSQGPTPPPTADITGTLTESDGCLRLATGGDSYLILWRPIHRVVYRDEQITVLTARDRELARVGDTLTVSGVTSPTLPLALDLPECPGPYLLAQAEQ